MQTFMQDYPNHSATIDFEERHEKELQKEKDKAEKEKKRLEQQQQRQEQRQEKEQQKLEREREKQLRREQEELAKRNKLGANINLWAKAGTKVADSPMKLMSDGSGSSRHRLIRLKLMANAEGQLPPLEQADEALLEKLFSQTKGGASIVNLNALVEVRIEINRQLDADDKSVICCICGCLLSVLGPLRCAR
jgi:hypothetical protein